MPHPLLPYVLLVLVPFWLGCVFIRSWREKKRREKYISSRKFDNGFYNDWP